MALLARDFLRIVPHHRKKVLPSVDLGLSAKEEQASLRFQRRLKLNSSKYQ